MNLLTSTVGRPFGLHLGCLDPIVRFFEFFLRVVKFAFQGGENAATTSRWRAVPVSTSRTASSPARQHHATAPCSHTVPSSPSSTISPTPGATITAPAGAIGSGG